MIELHISDLLAAAVPGVALGCVQATVSVTDRHPALDEALEQELAAVAARLQQTTITDLAPIAAARKAYRVLGKDPARYRVSSEALLRRVKQGKDLYRVNTVVDSNNLVSLHSGLSVGSYRIERLHPPIEFRAGQVDETYTGIGKGVLKLENLPLLADREGPFGSPTSDSERTMIGADTQAVLMVLIDLGGNTELTRPLQYAADTLEHYCAARNLQTSVIRGTD